MPRQNPQKTVSFEKGIERLEQIVTELDQTKVPLDEALNLFSEGIELVKHCNILLDSAEAKVKILIEDNSGQLRTEKMISGDNV